MKRITIILFFITGVVFGQDKVVKNLGDFNTIKTYRGLTVELVKSNSPKIEIEGDKSKDVIVKNVNGVLKISLEVLETFSAEDVKITLNYSKDIDHISANEGSVVFSDEKIKQEKIDLKASEAGQINLNIKTSYLDVKALTGGKIELEGTSTNQNVKANTGGIYQGDDLETEYTDVYSTTGGIVTVYASKLVDANASLGGTIKIKGDPDKVNKKESLGGYVKD